MHAWQTYTRKRGAGLCTTRYVPRDAHGKTQAILAQCVECALSSSTSHCQCYNAPAIDVCSRRSETAYTRLWDEVLPPFYQPYCPAMDHGRVCTRSLLHLLVFCPAFHAGADMPARASEAYAIRVQLSSSSRLRCRSPPFLRCSPRVRCMSCGSLTDRHEYQRRLAELNPAAAEHAAADHVASQSGISFEARVLSVGTAADARKVSGQVGYLAYIYFLHPELVSVLDLSPRKVRRRSCWASGDMRHTNARLVRFELELPGNSTHVSQRRCSQAFVCCQLCTAGKAHQPSM